MKLAWTRKTGSEPNVCSSGSPGIVLRGAKILSFSILKGKSAFLSASMEGIEGTC